MIGLQGGAGHHCSEGGASRPCRHAAVRVISEASESSPHLRGAERPPSVRGGDWMAAVTASGPETEAAGTREMGESAWGEVA